MMKAFLSHVLIQAHEDLNSPSKTIQDYKDAHRDASVSKDVQDIFNDDKK
jgi:hypothetical protein